MPDNPNIRNDQDRRRVNVHEDHELRDWSKKFGVSKDALKEAVQAVGDDAANVEAHLRARPGGSDRRR